MNSKGVKQYTVNQQIDAELMITLFLSFSLIHTQSKYLFFLLCEENHLGSTGTTETQLMMRIQAYLFINVDLLTLHEKYEAKIK